MDNPRDDNEGRAEREEPARFEEEVSGGGPSTMDKPAIHPPSPADADDTDEEDDDEC